MGAAKLELPCSEDDSLKEGLFQVWIDLKFGEPPHDWWWNSKPQPLRDALSESAELRTKGWFCQVTPAGHNPRPDMRWDNP